MIRKTLIAVAAIATMIPLAACSDDVDVDTIPTAAATTTHTNNSSNVDIAENAFILTVGDRFPGVSDDTMVDAALATCSALDAGNSIADVLVAGVSELGEDGAYFVGAAIGSFCPQYSSALDEFSDGAE